MISELQTGLLTPKSYFELYMEVFDQMAHLEMYFASLPRAGVSLSSVFEVVQYTGSVLVRLYVLAACTALTLCSARAFWLLTPFSSAHSLSWRACTLPLTSVQVFDDYSVQLDDPYLPVVRELLPC